MVQTFNEFRVKYYTIPEIKQINDEHDEALKRGLTPHREKVDINTFVSKEQTKRGTVRISQGTANTNNLYSHSKKLFYELAEAPPKKVEAKKKEVPAELTKIVDEPKRLTRDDIKATAKELGIEFPKNIKTKKLIELINEKQK